jgi:putative AlgH/UPF0301 family transcriptional regulator
MSTGRWQETQLERESQENSFSAHSMNKEDVLSGPKAKDWVDFLLFTSLSFLVWERGFCTTVSQ